ncbi:MAG: hypothetical protein ACU88J_04395 [Gammaproteobacteria bacterium]
MSSFSGTTPRIRSLSCSSTIKWAALSGKIIFAGQEIIGAWPMHKRNHHGITMAWQEPALFGGITVHDYLTLDRNRSDLSACLV